MSLYSHNGQYPDNLPFRITLSNGRTRTDPSTFTEQEIADAGYVAVSDKPSYDPTTQILTWENGDWLITDRTTEELQALENSRINRQWNEVRNWRDEQLKRTDIYILRNFEAGIPAEPDMVAYRQALRDLPQTQEDPFNIVWPVDPTAQVEEELSANTEISSNTANN